MKVIKRIGFFKKIRSLLFRFFPVYAVDYLLFFLKNGYFPRINSPQTFNEHIFYNKYRYRELRAKVLCDKYEVKEYITKRIGDEYLIPTIYVIKNVEDIDNIPFEMLINGFVMKPTLAAGLVYINKTIDIDEVKLLSKQWLKFNYYKYSREYQYNGKQKILFEALLLDKKKLPNDYKVHCFRGLSGEVNILLEVHSGRFESEHIQVFFDENLDMIPLSKSNNQSSYIKLPDAKLINKMFELSKVLSDGFNYVRVDWYINKEKIYFGELTFTPGNALSKFNPKEWDYKLGAYFL